MNTTHELDRRLSAFYAGEPHAKAPDRVLVDALMTIESTPQRRVLALAPWRFRPMNGYMKLAGAAAAIIAVAGFAVVGLQPNNGAAVASGSPPATSTPSAMPSSIPSPSVTPSPTSAAAIPLPDGHPAVALAPGRYSIPVPGSNLSVELTIGETGWIVGHSNASIFSPKLTDGAYPNSLTFGTVTNVFADACLDSSLPHPPIGPTVDDFVAALDAQKHTVMEQRSKVLVGGDPSTRFVMRAPEGLRSTCGNPGLWESVGFTKDYGFMERINLSRTVAKLLDQVFWAVDIDGTRVVITAFYKQADPGQSTLIQRMIDSIQFVRS